MTPMDIVQMHYNLTNTAFQLTVAREHIVVLERQRLQDAVYIHELSEGSDWLRKQNMDLLKKLKELRKSLACAKVESHSCSSSNTDRREHDGSASGYSNDRQIT